MLCLIELLQWVWFLTFFRRDGFRLLCSNYAVFIFVREYQIDHLQNEGLNRLRKEFPKTLEEWDKCRLKLVAIEDVDENIENIINLAHELSIPTVLPALYLYFLLNTSDMVSAEF